MSKILITGGTGFLGRQLFFEAKKRGFAVTLICRKEPEKEIFELADDIIYSKDLFEESHLWWEEALKNIDFVIHAAWYVAPGVYLNSTKQLDCLEGSLRFAKASTKTKLKKFLAIGTCFEYDLDFDLLSTSTPLKPNSLYSASKASLFIMLDRLFSQTKIDFIWPRLFYLYGEGDDENRLHGYITKQVATGEKILLGDGSKIRDYMDVKDAARETLQLLSQKTSGAYNICSGHGISICDFVEKSIRDLNGCSEVIFDTRPNNTVDPHKVVGVPGK